MIENPEIENLSNESFKSFSVQEDSMDEDQYEITREPKKDHHYVSMHWLDRLKEKKDLMHEVVFKIDFKKTHKYHETKEGCLQLQDAFNRVRDYILSVANQVHKLDLESLQHKTIKRKLEKMVYLVLSINDKFK
jgi:hypothetical protein